MSPPIIVGIAGGTASGKTTTARAISDRLGSECLWLMHDRYYRTMPESYRDDPTRFNFDHPDALDTPRMVADLMQLRNGHAIRVPDYDFATHERVPPELWEELHPKPVVIVEGILVLADPYLREAMDHKVFVHAPDDIRLVRRIRRDVSERGRSVLEILEQYERTVRPMHQAYVGPSQHHADLVVDGTTTTEAMVASVLGLLGDLPTLG